MRKLLRVGITPGDINGISYELILKLLSSPEFQEICTPCIFGSSADSHRWSQALGLEAINGTQVKLSKDIIDGRINWINLSDTVQEISIGQKTEEALKTEKAAMTAALEAWKNNDIDLIVTTPGQINQDNDGKNYRDLLSQATETEETPYTLYVDGSSRFIFLPKAETEEKDALSLLNSLQAINEILKRDFRLIRPRIAVVTPEAPAIVNKLPKVSSEEEGETTSLTPLREAVLGLQSEGLTVFGPFAIDNFFEQQLFNHYDACIIISEQAVYEKHISQIASESGYCYTAGLNILHTYPALDASYQSAGKNLSSPDPLRYAIYAGIDIYRARKSYREYTRKPLEKQWVPRGKDDYKLDLTKEDPA